MRRRALARMAAAMAALLTPAAIAACGDDEPETAGPTEAGERADAPTDRGGPPSRGKGHGRGRMGKGQGKPPTFEGGPPRAYPTSADLAYPNDVSEAGGVVARAVEYVIGAAGPKGERLAVIGADCRGGACSARYVFGPHGGGRMEQDASRVLRALFSVRRIKRVSLYVHAPRGRRSKFFQRVAMLTVTCDRSRHPRYRWSRITVRQMDRRCRVSRQPAGKLRTRIRRGQLSERDAGQGRPGRGSVTSRGHIRKAPRTVRPKPGEKPIDDRPRRDDRRRDDSRETRTDR